MSATSASAFAAPLPIRSGPVSVPLRGIASSPKANTPSPLRNHKHARSSYSELPPLTQGSRTNSFTLRPLKRQLVTPDKVIAIVNASGRQAASLIRNATAVGYQVRAQLRNLDGVIATEVGTNEDVQCLVGELYTRFDPSAENQDVTKNGPMTGVGINRDLINELFHGAQLAFINTTFYGDEVQIGKAIADAAKRANVQHIVFSSMPDHAHYNPEWPSLPLWSAKHVIEDYIREVELPATFVYTGIYNNNFSSLPYPLFQMELQEDGSFIWQAPFHEDAKLPWLDAEHDLGPAVLQIFKDGLTKWGGRRIALAYEMLSPREACAAFQRGLGRPVTYIRGPIELKVKIPEGYRVQLEALEKLFNLGGDDPEKQPPYFGDASLERSCPWEAMLLWEAPRGLEEYAREVFPLEEFANGLTWMVEDDNESIDSRYLGSSPQAESTLQHSQSQPQLHQLQFQLQSQQNQPVQQQQPHVDDETDRDNTDPNDDEGLVMKVCKRDEEDWLA